MSTTLETGAGDASSAQLYDTDTSDMRIPHGMFRNVLGSAGGVVAGVRPGDAEHATVVGSYFDNVLRFLDAHHGGEDAVVWPLLLQRSPEAREVVSRMEGQHAEVHGRRERAGAALEAFIADHADAASGAALGCAMADLTSTVEQHFAEEEREVLPLASRHMSPEEWGALPGHAMAHFSGDKVWLIFGLIFEQMSAEERAFTMTLLPPPAVDMWTSTGERSFNDFIARVRGGDRSA